jgi:hypothetical protein
VPEIEADMWLQIQDLIQLEEKASDDAEKEKFEAAVTRIENQLKQRLKSMLSMEEWVDVVNQLVEVPAIHREFGNHIFETFTKGRAIEVRSIMKLGIPSFLSA